VEAAVPGPLLRLHLDRINSHKASGPMDASSCQAPQLALGGPSRSNYSHFNALLLHRLRLLHQAELLDGSDMLAAGGQSSLCRADLSALALLVAAGLQQLCGRSCEPGKSRKQPVVHGNYRRYYGYRLGRDGEEDPRVQV
jgi:hypothetical protein